jgi:hypothetical protein
MEIEEVKEVKEVKDKTERAQSLEEDFSFSSLPLLL